MAANVNFYTVDPSLAFQADNTTMTWWWILGDNFSYWGFSVRPFNANNRVSLTNITTQSDNDLVQTTFLQVLRAARRFESDISVRGWLLGIASMMARRHRRSLGRLAKRVRTWATIPRAPQLTPDDALVQRHAGLRLGRALAALSPKKREAFVLVTLEGMSGEEAAAALGVPINTIWTRLHHARRELRERIGEDR